MEVTTNIDLLEELLAPWAERLGASFVGYKNHVYRVLNYSFALTECSQSDLEKLVIGGAFHDLGVWSDNTLDYLPPSADLAEAHLRKIDRAEWIEEVRAIVTEHHKITPVKDPSYRLAEAFRKGDLMDVAGGRIKFGLSRDTIGQITSAFAVESFFKKSLADVWRLYRANPTLNPLPMYKW